MSDKPNQDNLPSIGQMVENAQFRDALQGMGEILELSKKDIPHISESFFKMHLLDIIADTSGNADLEKWMGIAGHPGRPINVVNDQGTEVLFQVPPLMQWREMRFSKVGSASYRAIFERAAHMRDLSPDRAKRDMITELDQATPQIQPDLGQAVQIDMILRRYGRDPIFEDEVGGEGDAAPARTAETTSMPPAESFEDF